MLLTTPCTSSHVPEHRRCYRSIIALEIRSFNTVFASSSSFHISQKIFELLTSKILNRLSVFQKYFWACDRILLLECFFEYYLSLFANAIDWSQLLYLFSVPHKYLLHGLKPGGLGAIICELFIDPLKSMGPMVLHAFFAHRTLTFKVMRRNFMNCMGMV